MSEGDGVRKRYEQLVAETEELRRQLAVFQQRNADLERERAQYLESHARLVREHQSVGLMAGAGPTTMGRVWQSGLWLWLVVNTVLGVGAVVGLWVR